MYHKKKYQILLYDYVKKDIVILSVCNFETNLMYMSNDGAVKTNNYNKIYNLYLERK